MAENETECVSHANSLLPFLSSHEEIKKAEFPNSLPFIPQLPAKYLFVSCYAYFLSNSLRQTTENIYLPTSHLCGPSSCSLGVRAQQQIG